MERQCGLRSYLFVHLFQYLLFPRFTQLFTLISVRFDCHLFFDENYMAKFYMAVKTFHTLFFF